MSARSDRGGISAEGPSTGTAAKVIAGVGAVTIVVLVILLLVNT